MKLMKTLNFGCAICLLTLCYLFPTLTVAQQATTSQTLGASFTPEKTSVTSTTNPTPGIAKTQTQAKPAQAETASADREVLQQLLREVRELRLAVQRATVNNTRFQMLIERVRIGQGHVDATVRQLENVRSHLADIRASKPQFEHQIKDAESLLERTSDMNARADLESRIKTMKSQFARFGPEEERLQSRETTLNFELQTAQSKLNELNGMLDAMMNELKAP